MQYLMNYAGSLINYIVSLLKAIRSNAVSFDAK